MAQVQRRRSVLDIHGIRRQLHLARYEAWDVHDEVLPGRIRRRRNLRHRIRRISHDQEHLRLSRDRNNNFQNRRMGRPVRLPLLFLFDRSQLTVAGRPTGFRNAENQLRMHPSDSRMSDWGPLTYTVGSSSLTDFPMAVFKSVNNPVTIVFTATSAQTGAATLRIGTTLSFAGGRPQATVCQPTAYIREEDKANKVTDQQLQRDCSVGTDEP